MLFDLEDYATSRIIGLRGTSPIRTANQINWEDPHTTFRATRDAYMKAINEYYLAAAVVSTTSERQQLDIDYLDLMDSFVAFNQSAKIFWPALESLPIKGAFQEGEKYNLQWVSIDDTTTGIDFWFPNEYYIPEYQQQVSGKTVAVLNENGDYTYSTFTQAIYDDYKNKLVTFQSKVKTLMLHGEGQSVFQEWVTPEVMPYETYPELSGYVRGTNSLSIQNAVVRLTDAEGVTHDVVTDSKGYYIFTKEFIYNNVSLGATGSVFDLNMNLLPTKTDGTVLYNTTSKFQNSFFGAVNNRGMNWPQRIVMNKPARRNFKIEFIPDYSNFPSFSGYVKDVVGNPIKDAYVQIKDSWTGAAIGQYIKPNGDWGMNFKYNDFGTDRTVLTDENGFYEYTSQMVGEWFHNQLMSVGETPGKLGGRPFDEYFGSREDLIATTNEYVTGLSLQYKESFLALLIPYKQDANLTSIKWEGVQIYDEQDYYASRFKYALNQYNEFQYQRIDLNTHYDIDVDVTVATNDEFRADKIAIELERGRKNLPIDQNHYFWFESTYGYVKVVYPSTGESYVTQGWYNSGWHINVMENQDTYSDFYFYACDSIGRAMGYIKNFTAPTYTKSIDFSDVKYLQYLSFDRFYGETIDFSNLEHLINLDINSHLLKNIIGLDNSYRRLSNIYLSHMPIESLDFSSLTKLISINLTNLHKLDSLVLSQNITTLFINNCDVNLDITGLNRLNNIEYNKLTMTSDDVDDLINQLDSTEINYGTINIGRISRSSFSDEAYDILVNQKYWNINLGQIFYDELIVPDKLILTVDDTKVDGEYFASDTDLDIQTTTGYWIGKNWNGDVFGYAPSYYTNNRRVQGDYMLGIHDGTIEIYSCDEYGVPAGEIQSIQFYDFKFSDIDTSQLSGLTNINFHGTAELTSLDFRFNTALTHIYLYNSNKVQSIDVTGLTSLQHLEISNCAKIENVIGFSTLTSLIDFSINTLPKLNVLSLTGFSNIRNFYINEVDLYDSTHVDTMLSELNISSTAKFAYFDTQIATKQAELYVKQSELDIISADLNLAINSIDRSTIDTLRNELAQLISNGADQTLIDAKQAEVTTEQAQLDADQAQIDAKQAELDFTYSQYQAIQSLIDSLNQDRNSYSSGLYFNTNYMARTSASDVDYNSLINYGWNLNIGSEFVAPYTAPVIGYITIGDVGGNTMQFNNQFRIATTTGWAKVVAPGFTGGFNVSSQDYISSNVGTTINLWSADGVLEFYSCDSHGRPSGSIINFGKTGDTSRDFFIKSLDISNLTNIEVIYFESGFSEINTFDLSSNVNIKSISIIGWNQLETIIGFENLLDLKDIYISEASSLDIPVDFTLMVDLQRISITNVGINKNSRLNISGLSKLQEINIHWTYMISADLDTALSALDAAGLDSSSDFGYEGHLPWFNNLNLIFGMGIGFHTEFESAYNSLLDKGWNINIGDQIIDTIEDPVKGIVRWGMDASWISLGFSYKQDRIVKVKSPNGNIETVSGVFSYNFDSNTPEANRFIEFWGVDNYGRPRQDAITNVYDNSGTGITSFEVNNVKSIEELNIQFPSFTSVDLSNMNNLKTIYIENTDTLLSLNVDGCSKIRNVFVNEDSNLDIDGLLESLDGTGSEGDSSLWGNNQISANGLVRTHASDAFVESLSSKKWNINVIDPAGTTVVINVIQQQYVLINVATTGGAVKFEFPVGSEMYNWAGPNGYIQYSCKYRGENDFNQTSLSFYPDFTGQVRITSVYSNNTDIVSGEVRMLQFQDQGTLDYSTATKVRSIYLNSAHSLTMLPYLANLQLDSLNIFSYQGATLNLSQFISKGIHIYYAESQNVILNQNYVKKLSLEYSNQLVSVNIPDTVEILRISSPLVQVGTVWPSVLTNLYLENMHNIEEISGLPTSLEYLYLNGLNNLDILDISNSVIDLNLTNVSLNGVDLDLSGSNIRDIYISSSQLASIDVTGSTNLYSINLYYTSLDIIGFETSNVRYFYDYYSGNSNYNLVLPDTFIDGGIYSSNTITSFDVSVENDTWLPNAVFNINDLSNLNGQNSFPSIKTIQVRQLNSSIDLTSIDSRTTLIISNLSVTSLDFTGVSVNELNISYCQSLTTITGLSGSMQTLSLDYLNQLTNIDLSNISTNNMSIYNVSNFTGAVNSTNLYINNCSNINLSGSNINYLQAYSCYGSMNLSNVTCNWQIRVWWGSISSINLDGTNVGEISIQYINGYTPPGPGQTTQNWTISAVGTIVNGDFSIYNNQRLTSVNTTGTTTSISRYNVGNNTHLTSLSVSFRNTTNFYSYNNLNSLLISDAELSSSQLGYVGVFRISGSNTATFIDTFINSVSPTNANNGQLRATDLNLRTSSSTTGFNKLMSQGWTSMSV